MKRTLYAIFAVLISTSLSVAGNYETLTENFVRGKADLQSMSVMTFGPEGILFVGDSQSGKVFALDLDDRTEANYEENFAIEDIESKLASLLGTQPNEVIIHDMAVNPISKNIYLAASRANALELGFWKLPNDIANANILLKVNPNGDIEEVPLDNIKYSESVVPKIINTGSQNWRKSDNRTEAITDIAYDDGKLYVTGLSNEEFASALRVLSFPFDEKVKYSTIEVYHVAHKKSETEAPIRNLLPYSIEGKKYIIASYTCTPLVSIPVGDLENGKHVVSKTLAELGSGNMPIDMITYDKNGKDYILMSNSSKALIRINPDEIAGQDAITEPMADGQYTIGLPHDVLSKVGVSQIDNFGKDKILLLWRQPNGLLNISSYPNKWM